MQTKTLSKILLETLPLIGAIIVTYFFWHNSLLLTFLFIIMIFGLLKFTYQKGDLFAFLYGSLLGFLIEAFETTIVGFHHFTNADFFGMPLWMPIAWGYGFMLMKRIGVIMYKDAQKVL